jgi:hypothetical protein
MTDLENDRASFVAVFGNVAALIDSLQSAQLVVPLDVDGRVGTWVWGGLPWLTAFTDAEHCGRFAEAAGRDSDAVEIRTLPGSVLVGELLDRAPTPTGLVVDAGSPDVLVFPPVRALTPHRYIDEETGQVVMK